MARAELAEAAADGRLATLAHHPFVLATRRLLRRRVAMVALVIILVIYLSGLLAPWAAPYSFREIDLGNVFAGPSLEHPFGTDRLGRDILSRVMWSAQTTVIISVLAVGTGSLVLGVGLGLLSGYRGGWVDTLIMRLVDLISSMPSILILILVTATVRLRWEDLWRDFEGWSGIGSIRDSGATDFLLVFGILALLSWGGMARFIRAQVLALREGDYIMAARAMGASTWRVVWVHLLPNVTHLIIVVLTASLGAMAGLEVFLAFLGIGVRPPHPSFGIMIFEGSGLRQLQAHPNLLLIPGAVIRALLISFNLLG
ncbi:MAG: ABC transporter permease, partial [Dehalococcoidia bacterium]